MTSRFRLIGQALGFGFALGLVAGCSNDELRPIRQSPAEARQAARAPIPEMAGDGKFFDGQIEAEVQLGRAPFAPRASASSESEGRPSRSGPGGFSGGLGGGGGRRGGRGMGGGGRGGGDLPSTDEGPGRTGNAGAIRASQEPTVRLRLRVTNHGTEPAEVEVTDFDSSLGNFVVQPRKLTIPPGESVEMDPMNSQLGVPGGEIPLTVGVRANGKTEKQTVTLKVKEPAAAAANGA